MHFNMSSSGQRYNDTGHRLSYAQIAAKPPPPPSPIDQQARVPPDGISKKTMQVQRQVDEVTEIMQQNINKVLQRGENIDSLQTKTEEMSVSAQAFQRKAKSTRRKISYYTRTHTETLLE
ncbi:hypothetical protein BB558_007354 [Smittium angustum]|uniref:V-SNARE coiled-coil homology domain-containing protein n=1 Tax=Smittium angustum TaxID=133377 RepID=A0A2U1IV88_SMIAN|nr:hypothetical protein BB558_007354 [Smittium angustum]